MSPREAAVLERTVAALHTFASASRYPAYFFKTEGNGQPDLVGTIAGRSVVCEVKQPGEKPTKRQIAVLRNWDTARAVALWTDGKKWVRIRAWTNGETQQDPVELAELREDLLNV